MVMNKKTIDGSQFMCSKHKLDYRLCCEECKEKYAKFVKVLAVAKKEKVWPK